jgi:hypothetical protein
LGHRPKYTATQEFKQGQQDQHTQITQQHKKVSMGMCSRDDHALVILWKWVEEEKSFEGDTLVWVFLFSLKMKGNIIFPFLRISSIEIHLG